MLNEFFIRKANYNRIQKVLDKENFFYTEQNIHELLAGNQKGIRYGNIVLSRTENGENIKRFLKIILDGKRKTYRLFRRQVEISKSLYADKNYTPPTMRVIKSSFELSVPYAIFETRENGKDFGFMNDTLFEYENLTKQEIQQFVKTLYLFHLSGFDISATTLKHTQKMHVQLSYYKKEFSKLLGKKIIHKTKDGTDLHETVEKLLERYTHISDIRFKLIHILEQAWKHVRSSQTEKGYYLVHADMQIDNIYKHKDGTFELIDFEWVGRSKSPVISIMYDYGNIRARAWSSPKFQKRLDEAMFDIGLQHYKDKELVNAAMTLGMIRSSLMMSRYHMDFINTVKKDRRTEKDYYQMYQNTIATLTQALT
ncbi:MAG: hypothetical protein ACUZ8E_12615 [Candidatus Anammoxibacter sp.]